MFVFSKCETMTALRLCVGRSAGNCVAVLCRQEHMYSAASNHVQIAYSMGTCENRQHQSSAMAALLNAHRRQTCYCQFFTDSFNFVVYTTSSNSDFITFMSVLHVFNASGCHFDYIKSIRMWHRKALFKKNHISWCACWSLGEVHQHTSVKKLILTLSE